MQYDIDASGPGDACSSRNDLLALAGTMKGLNAATTADATATDITAIMKDTLFSQSVRLEKLKSGYTVLSLRSGAEASRIYSATLKLYVNAISTGTSLPIQIYAYNKDGVTPFSTSMVTASLSSGWNTINATQLVHTMNSFGFTKLRLAASSGWADISEASLEAVPYAEWQAAISATSLDFGSIEIPAKPSRSLTIANSGTGNLVIGTISTPALPFAITTDTCSGKSLAGGQSCRIDTLFIPTVAGTFNSAINITTNDPDNTSALVSLSGVATPPATINGTVTDQTTGLPLSGINVKLEISGIGSKDPADRVYKCNGTPLTTPDYTAVAENDSQKFSCKGGASFNSMNFKVRNPFGADSFTARWNGIGTLLESNTEYLAQSFKPTKSGKLTKVSFHLPSNLIQTVAGRVYVILKSALGGDRGIYLASSNVVDLSTVASGAPLWVDFNFPTPQSITSGQEYYLEINGTFINWAGAGGYLYQLYWSNSNTYANGREYERRGGIWLQSDTSLAFRTYLDGQADITATPSASTSYMYGGNSVDVEAYILNPITGYNDKNIPIIHNGDGYNGYNGDDLTGTITVADGLDRYYDLNGWIEVKAYASSVWNTTLVTDQFSLTFNRAYSTTTDSNGAYSFPNLLAGNYSITYGGTKTSSGVLNPGQQMKIDTQLPTLPPMMVNIASPSDKTLINSSKAITVSGTISTNATVNVNGIPATVTNNNYSADISLNEGLNTITATAANLYGQTAASSIKVIYNATPRIVAAPTALDFGSVKNDSIATLSVEVSNVSTENIQLAVITRPSAPFWVISDDCSGTTLPPTASCHMTMQFVPTTPGIFTSELVIPLEESLQQHLAIALKGTAAAFKGYYLPDTGQSGETPRNPLNYTVNSDKVVTDINTGLMWERDGSSVAMPRANAGTYCTTLVKDGFTGWRLPTFLELDTIVHYGHSNPAIDLQIFPATQPDKYWSATGDTTYPQEEAKTINFGYGESQSWPIEWNAYVRCVRGTTLIQDGSVFEGSWMNPNDGGTLVDADSGLIWMYAYFVPNNGWTGAMNSCQSISYGGRTGWRAPSIKELATLTTQTCSLSDCYPWSTTRSNKPDSSGQFTQVFAGSAAYDIISANKTAALPLRCVRAGNAVPKDPQKLSVSPPVLDFGYPLLGNSADRIVTISNAGSGNLTIEAIPALGAPFSIVSENCSGRTLSDAGSCTITVRSLSSSPGSYSGSFAINSNDADTPNITVRMIGTVALPETALSGKVTDSAGNPIAGVTIAVTDPANVTRAVTTNFDGNYLFTSPPIGAFHGVMTKTGYSVFAFSGSLVNKQKLTINGVLAPILPQISTLSVVNITADSATIQWTTDQASTGAVEYGESGGYGSTIYDTALTTAHSVTVTGLSSLTSYHFRVVATNIYGLASTSSDRIFTVPAFAVKLISDTGNVTVMEITGNFDGKNTDGSQNDQPRKAVATEYFKNHPDKDFLVFFSTFDYTMPEVGAQGFYTEVKNDTQGINRTLLNNAAQFGSAGMLQGTIDMGNVTQLSNAPTGGKLDETVTTLNHELAHRWLAAVRFKNPDRTLNTSLLGKDSAHWSYLLDSKGSIMYGNGWRDNGNGTFTSVSKQSSYSPLDLYLMGMIPKEQVPPMLLIENPAIDKTQLPSQGATVTGTAKSVTIDDIIAAEGVRIPDHTTSQKTFDIGFVLLTRAGDNATSAVQAVETLRKAWAGRFAELTQGKGSITNIPATLEVTVDSPNDGATITGPDVNVSGSIINSSGAETGVTVNGILAAVSGNRFTVNHIPLQTGSNTLTVTATDANGLTKSTARTVTAQAGNYIRITGNIDSGTAPLNISLRLNGSFSITNPQLTVQGPVTVNLQLGAQSGEYTATFTVEGAYTVTASAQGPDGQIYTDSITITLIPRYHLETLLKGKWEGLRSAVTGGDINSAINYFVPARQEKYRSIFTNPAYEAATRFSEISHIEVFTAKDKVVQAGAIKTELNVEYAYPLIFIQDTEGVWKIFGF